MNTASDIISDPLKPGRLFGSFELQHELDNGGAGTTWLAQDYSVRRHDNQVGLRFLPDSIASDTAAVQELKNEIRRTIALKHPNILRVYDLVENKGRTAIEMEYQDGQSLSGLRLTRPNQIFEVRDLENWVETLCKALEYAHQDCGLVHGEIQPGNLIVDLAGNLKVKDFGIANCINGAIRRLNASHNTGETLPYRSPQLAAGEEATISDDLYSLGATLYELLTSSPPLHAGEIGAQVSGKILASMTQRRAELGIAGAAIPKNWEETVAACLAKDPVHRPQSASEVEKRLHNATSRLDTAAQSNAKSEHRSTAKPQRAGRTPAKRKQLLAIIGIIFFLACALPIAFLAFHPGAEPEFGRIVLDTIPSTANVFLEGASRGTTPLVIPDVVPGDRQLRIELQGYEPRTLSVIVKPDGEFNDLIHLVRLTEPSSASLVALSPSASTGAGSSLPVAPPSPEASPTPAAEISPTPAPQASPTATPVVITTVSIPAGLTQESVIPGESQAAEASPTPVSQPDIGSTREEVIKRINALPGVSAEKKANLIDKMQKARSMERLTIIPFEVGQTSLHRAAMEDLVKAFETPEMQDKLGDPTIVLVVAGYSDTGGRADLNLRLSQARAENVSKILKEQARLLNATQTIGMGGTELLNDKRPEQNRAVEVWAVVPL